MVKVPGNTFNLMLSNFMVENVIITKQHNVDINRNMDEPISSRATI